MDEKHGQQPFEATPIETSKDIVDCSVRYLLASYGCSFLQKFFKKHGEQRKFWNKNLFHRTQRRLSMESETRSSESK